MPTSIREQALAAFETYTARVAVYGLHHRPLHVVRHPHHLIVES
jgi:hypothetical protein